MERSSGSDRLLIVSCIPYFLEKGNIWFEKNINKILDAQKTQIFFQENAIFLEENKECHFSNFLRKLDEMGYEKVLTITEPGEFSKRGGVIDLFPVNLMQAARIEFYGNKIENILELPIKINSEKEIKDRLIRKLKRREQFSIKGTIKPGEYLVHLDHGIGKFAFLKDGYYVLEYDKGDRLYVPLGLERKLSRHIGFREPVISRLSSSLWEKTKKKVKEETEKLAKELLEIYAKREVSRRPPYLKDDEMQNNFEAAFGRDETPDQLQAIEDIKNDLYKDFPMDRIVCGDVGFGKTEISLRAAFKAITSGRQTAMICPTTILANQHFQTVKDRLKNFPVKAALISRIQTKKEQKEIIKKTGSGEIDLLLGTHRILSNDIEFKNLGLLIIDDEQKFGVRQKEKLKKIRPDLDVLSLSATPIPRTLYLALSSLKGISLIQTPPPGRLSINTKVMPWQEKEIKKAIELEINRGGQIYYLHNRIETIGAAKSLLEELSPECRIGVAHGKMKEKELINMMNDFKKRKFDILVATTIIENGIDLPNVNTIIVAEAANLGLAQAHQIRGRVGRSTKQAFAYFFFGKSLSQKAKLRLKALKQAQELGSGYKIALRDLEIRGAGNVLGKEQSGSINQVGLNLYCQMLSDTIEKLKPQYEFSNS
ncbi:MAG: DEAD/DEAH box helicase [Candidatus Nealsonbacteria bacterium]|nr:DEAD/DEAH box helicase [Candidatus Nealsonbacteria bacterium]